MDYTIIEDMKASRLILGMMRIADMSEQSVDALVRTALDIGINMFDHADIYGGGTCEKLFGAVLSRDRTLRERMIIQTKCGILPGERYDLSYDHIVRSAEGSLKRLGTDYIDVLLLHRPDALMRPEQIARAFDELLCSGKARAFGVSNFSAQQTDYLSSAVDQRLFVNQLQLSPVFCPAIEWGINVNTPYPEGCGRDGGMLEYARKNGVIIQTYGTMQCAFTDADGPYCGSFLSERGKKHYFALDYTLSGLAQKHGASQEAIVAAWIMHHPARMQAVIGTTNVERLKSYRGCGEIELSDREWYEIYRAAGHRLP